MSYLRYWLWLIALTTLYYLSAQAGLFIAVYYGDVTPLWPPSGIALAAFWMGGWRWWPMVLIGETLTALSLEQSIASGLWGGVAQLVEVSVAIGIIQLLKLSPSLKSLRETVLFCSVVALTAPAVSSFLGAGTLLVQNEIGILQFLQTYVTWWLGDTLGILVITPLITCWWKQRPPLNFFLKRWVLTTLIVTCALSGFLIASLFYEKRNTRNLLLEEITGWHRDAAYGCNIIEVCPLFEASKDGTRLNPISAFLSRVKPEKRNANYRCSR